MRPISFGILTVSDSCFQDPTKDRSGPAAEECIKNLLTEGTVLCKDIVPDDEDEILVKLHCWAKNKHPNVILTLGGTGFGKRDVTPEATRRVLDKEAPGIITAMMLEGLKAGPHAMLSRAVAGIRKESLIINLPGSPKAVKECITTVAPVLQHAVSLILDEKSLYAEDHKRIQCSKENRKATAEKMPPRDLKNRPRHSPFPMIDYQAAKEMLKQVVESIRLDETEWTEIVSLEKCYGRILAEDIASDYDLPPFRASIKDGYAVLAEARNRRRTVIGGSEAGDEPGSVEMGPFVCVRVNTGAPVPDEATAVVQIEDTEVNFALTNPTLKQEAINILVAPKPNQDIRPIGSDIQKGEQVLEKFTKIGAVEAGILAACGVSKVPVTRIPIVGILSTGNELQSPGEPLKPYHVYDSNKITLAISFKECGYDSLDFGCVRDEWDLTVERIATALSTVDILITSGSVSMGDKDLLKDILVKEFNATIHFGRVNLKPGKPTTFATCVYKRKTKCILCLPGNPVSATVTAQLFAMPLMRYFTRDQREPTLVKATITSDWSLDPRPEFARAVIRWADGDFPEAYITGNQISSRLLSCKSANALLVLPGATEDKSSLKKGDLVSAMLLGFCTNTAPITF